MGTGRILLISALVLAIGGGIYGYKEYNRGIADASSEEASASVDAAQLVSDFVADENAANAKYTGKILQVTGTVKSIDGNAVLIAAGPDDSEVSCTFDTAPAIRAGNRATIKGECAGFDALIGAQVQLVRCAIVE